MNPIYLIEDVESEKFEQKLESELKTNFKNRVNGMKVAVKLHMGEDKGMFSPELAKRAISVLNKLGCKPFLFDTPVNYPGNRNTKERYEKNAALHGFTIEKMGCPVIISDDYVHVKMKNMVVEVSKELAESDALLVLSHVKGHDCSGMGGALKNIAMGCVSPKSKGDQHGMVNPIVSDECTACGLCAEICPFKAISISDKAMVNDNRCGGCTNCIYNCPSGAISTVHTFDELMAEAVAAVFKAFKNKPVYYVNDVRRITKRCDCFGNPGEPVAKDVGVILGSDIVAIDKASIDLVNKQESENKNLEPGKDFFKELTHHDPMLPLNEAVKMKLGKLEYELGR